MDYKDDFVVQPARNMKKLYEVDFDALRQSAVEAQITKEVDYISGILGVEVSAAHRL